MPKEITTIPAAKIRRVLRREMGVFFTKLRAPEPGWPEVPPEELIEALADALFDQSRASKHAPTAYAQMLVHELQERINQELKG
jgi:hypothetical protein